MKTAVMMFIVLALAAAWAMAGDLDKEVNAFKVQLVSRKSYMANHKKKATKVKHKKTTAKASYATPKKLVTTKKVKKADVEIADEAIKLEPQHFSEDLSPSPSMSYTARPAIKKSSSGLFVRATALPQFMISAFDGGDDSNISPRGLTDSTKSGFAGNVTMDLNLFNHENLVIESGVAFMQMGAKTGIKQNANGLYATQQYPYNYNPAALNNNGITYEDELLSQYLGVVVAGKWMFAGQEGSSLYVRGGVLPMFLMSKTYNAGTGYSPYTPYNYGTQILQNNDSRFGSVNTFDIAAQFGIGYSLKLTRDFNIVADITGTQGFLPVVSNYSIYNAAIGAGLGISYRL